VIYTVECASHSLPTRIGKSEDDVTSSVSPELYDNHSAVRLHARDSAAPPNCRPRSWSWMRNTRPPGRTRSPKVVRASGRPADSFYIKQMRHQKAAASKAGQKNRQDMRRRDWQESPKSRWTLADLKSAAECGGSMENQRLAARQSRRSAHFRCLVGRRGAAIFEEASR